VDNGGNCRKPNHPARVMIRMGERSVSRGTLSRMTSPTSQVPPTSRTEPSAFVARLPIGERLPLPEIAHWDIFPFEGDLQIKVLDPPLLPEPPRAGEPGGSECFACSEPERGVLWRDEHWHVRYLPQPTGLPAVLMLFPNQHLDLDDLPDDLAAGFGLMIRRLSKAVQAVDGVARVHVNRWGDGGAHLHVWFLARPAGMWQLRGTCLAIWDDLLPPVPVEEWLDNLRRIGAALAADGGTANEPVQPEPNPG